MNNPLLHQVTQRVDECYVIAEERLRQSFPKPKITLNQRGKVAGSARLQTNEIRFNPVLLADNLSEFLNEVIPHEICHLLVYQLHGKVRPHGTEWQALMKGLYGLQGKAHHKMDVSKVAGESFLYHCQCGPVELSLRRHNKVLRGKQAYLCRKCGSELKRN